MFFKKKKKEAIPDLWNFMTSLNKKDKAIFVQFLENENKPLEFKGDIKKNGLLNNKKMIERTLIQKEEDQRLKDYTLFRIQPEIYTLLKPSYDQFYAILKK